MAKQPAHYQMATQAERASYASYSMKSRGDLQVVAVGRNITGASGMSKEDLITALMAADG